VQPCPPILELSFFHINFFHLTQGLAHLHQTFPTQTTLLQPLWPFFVVMLNVSVKTMMIAEFHFEASEEMMRT